MKLIRVGVLTMLGLLATAPPVLGGMFFNGVNGTINYGERDRLKEIDGSAVLTACFTLNVNQVKAQTFLSKTSDGGNASGFVVVAGTGSVNDISLNIAGQSARVVNGALADGRKRWCFVFDGSGTGNLGRVRIYKDGVYQTITFSGVIPATLPNPDVVMELCVASHNLCAALFAGADIAQIRIWVAALNSDEIQVLKRQHQALWKLYVFLSPTLAGRMAEAGRVCEDVIGFENELPVERRGPGDG